jgi:hypothetical protein
MTPNYVACGRRKRGESMRIAFEEVREGDIEGGGEVVVGSEMRDGCRGGGVGGKSLRG